MKNYKSTYPTDGLFIEELLFFSLSLNIMPHLDNFHRKDVSISLATTQNQFLTIFMHEIPELEKEIKERMVRDLTILSVHTLLVGCYEKIKKLKLGDESRIMEFFRHIRNAAAHDGKFNIRHDSLNKPASWRNKTISHALHDKELFSDFFAIGDSILFLQDVEKHIAGDKSKWLKEEEPPVLRRHPAGILWPKDPRHWFYKFEVILLRIKNFFSK